LSKSESDIVWALAILIGYSLAYACGYNEGKKSERR